jgi:Ferritin-like domain
LTGGEQTGIRAPRTRRELLLTGAGAAAAATVIGTSRASAAAGSSTDGAGSGPPETESSRVYRLLDAELLVLFTYDHILAGSTLPADARRTLSPLRAQEHAHVHALRGKLASLGSPAPSGPASVEGADADLARRDVKGRLGQLQGPQDALRLLLAIERVVIGAYFVALAKLEDRRLIGLVTRMMANDAQHEALVGELMYPTDPHKAVPFGLVQGAQ